jgi:hypothetical protein
MTLPYETVSGMKLRLPGCMTVEHALTKLAINKNQGGSMPFLFSL